MSSIRERRDARMREHILSKVRPRTDEEIRTTLYTPEDVAQHASPDDAWISHQGLVYDVTHYIQFHPGGRACMDKYMGGDTTHASLSVHRWVDVAKMLRPLAIGTLVPSRYGGCEPITENDEEKVQ
ncbi:Ferrihemoglobin reductase [Giardia muris]|uniref:Ferrihemoglobin reductase n=1 Tax=Giardia muris TaxID=5742 RepID=A0A4Z1T3U0_GIAMU|nr:Ferrihemoglobin reductase [Giardia muris]|eukprot:TNJ27061.1 Ferrihemoglobin reductase [Giardia muris]